LGVEQDRVAATDSLAIYDEVGGCLEDALRKLEDLYG
jgi:hypothetical protein